MKTKEWMHYDVDFSNCRYHFDLHEELRIKLEFPDFYGQN